jgi:hypothetical protein
VYLIKRITQIEVRFQVLSLVEVYQHFRSACCLHHQGNKAASTSEMSVNFFQTIWCNNSENSHLHRLRVFADRVLGEYLNLREMK